MINVSEEHDFKTILCPYCCHISIIWLTGTEFPPWLRFRGLALGCAYFWLIKSDCHEIQTPVHLQRDLTRAILTLEGLIQLTTYCLHRDIITMDPLPLTTAARIGYSSGTLPLFLSYRGVDKSLARPNSRCILFDGENISFDASLFVYINSTNIPPIIIINRIHETQNLLSL